MADDGGAKRLKKTSQDGVAVAEVAELRRRVEELRMRNAELESENERLRSDQRGRRREEGNHEVLPAVVTVTVKVDLSRMDSSIVAHITSFLGTPRELLDLALTCKSFGWRPPTSTLNWSLVEEVARQAVCLRATDDEMDCLPHYANGTMTWLSVLYRYEHLLDFNVLLGCYIEHRNGDKATVRTSGNDGISVAVSSNCVMTSGVHFAQFSITGVPDIGVVRPMPGLDAGEYDQRHWFSFFYDDDFPNFLAQRSDGWGDSNVHACDFSCDNGKMSWTDWDGILVEEWEGMESCQSGDTVGMLLNLDEGTLSVYKNNRRLGVMKDGLSGSYCWCVTLEGGDTVTIKEAQRTQGETKSNKEHMKEYMPDSSGGVEVT